MTTPDYSKPCITCQCPVTTGADRCWSCVSKRNNAAQAKHDAIAAANVAARDEKARATYFARHPHRALFNGGNKEQRAKVEAERAARMNESLSPPDAVP